MSAIVRTWDTLWFGPVLDVRVWLIRRMLLLMLALDTWVLMIERGGRYGAGNFNVAHFAWLDAIQPVPTAALYVGLILTCGVLAMWSALGALGRVGVVLLTLTYTYAWSMSQLDSYQHHVFISWLLLCLCCFPTLRTRQVLEAPRMVCAWGYRLLAMVTAVLYVFTGISKAEPQWLSGGVLKRINGTGGELDVFIQLFANLGFEEATFWTIAGYSVVWVQWVIAWLWLSALVWGEGGQRWVRNLRLLGVAAAVAFHVGAEFVGLRIGWFSWYMVALTLVAFAPEAWLRRGAAVVAHLTVRLSTTLAPHEEARPRLVWGALSVAAVICYVVTGRDLDLPGIAIAGTVWAAMMTVFVAVTALRGRSLRAWAIAGAITICCLGVTMNTARVRYDFYRYVGGDATRRLKPHAALDAYGRANTYAPEGEGRHSKVDKVRASLHGRR